MSERDPEAGSAQVPAEGAPPSDVDAAPALAGEPPDGLRDLPKWNRARTKRKAPADAPLDDGFQQGVKAAGVGAVRRWPTLLIGAGVLAGVIGAGVWYVQSSAASAAAATRLLAEAAAPVGRGRIAPPEALAELPKDGKPPVPLFADAATRDAAAMSALDALAEAAPGSKADRLGALVRAGRLLEQGDGAGAAALYEGFLAAAGDDHELTFLAREGLANALLAQGDRAGALRELETLLSAPDGFYRDQALYRKARVLELDGQTDAAIAAYKQYATEFPLNKSSFAQAQVQEQLKLLAPDFDPASVDPASADPAAATPAQAGAPSP